MKEKNVVNSASARWSRFSASRACLHALAALFVVFATGLLPVSAQNDATNRPPVQTFYLPIPEEDLLETLTSIHGGASQTKTLFAGANEVYDTTFFGTEFVVPVGENTANQNEIFQYTGATSPSAATASTTSATSTCRPRRRSTRSRSTSTALTRASSRFAWTTSQTRCGKLTEAVAG